MSDYVPDADKQVAEHINRYNQAALVQECSGPVNINITGSTLSIVASSNASQEQGATNAKQTTSSDSSDLNSKLARINKSSWKTTSVKITEPCNDEKLNEPDFQVYPQMRKVEDYYKGGYAEIQPEIMVEEKPKGCLRFFRQSQKKILKNQCIKERGFNLQQSTSEGDSATIESLVESIMKDNQLKADEKLDVTAFVASAGSGKTTLLRRLARQIMIKSGITEENGFSVPNQSRFHMVNYIELKNVQDEESITVAEFLFGGMFTNKRDVKDTYEWLLNNQSEAILCLDGFDQMAFGIEKTNQVAIKPHQKASPATIMYNLLSRNLLPHLQIVMTSREFAISGLQAESRPQNIVTLTGLSQQDAKNLFIALIGINGPRAWDMLSTASRGLLHFVSIPVFLILTAIIMSRHSDSPPPDTVTGLFSRVIEILPSAENIQERERIIDVLNKLKKMAHEGMLQGRITFNDDDLKRHGLSIEDVRDLMIKVPGKNMLSRYLLESRNYIIFFFHQSFQEFLSACFISEMNLGNFKIFNRQNLHEDRWSVVRRFSCGLIHDENLSLREDLHKIPDKKTKQQILRKSLASKLKKVEGYQLLEIYATFYESNDYDYVSSTIRQIRLQGTSLGQDGAHALSSIMIRCESLNLLYLHDCGINDKLLRIMAENMRGHKLHVKILSILIRGFTIAGLNCLLENMIVDTLETIIDRNTDVGTAALNWENIRKVTVGGIFGGVMMTKMSDSINIHYEQGKFSGIFDMQVKMLRIQITNYHYRMVESLVHKIPDIEKLLKPNSVTVVLKEGITPQYLEYGEVENFQSIPNWKFEGKIKKLFINCNFVCGPSVISSIARFLPIEVMDIALNYNKRDVTPVDSLLEQLSHYIRGLNIHWCYRAVDADDMTELTSSLSQNPVDDLRLYICYKRPLEDLKTFIKECEGKNLSIIFEPKYDLSESDKRKLMQIAELSDTDLEIREKCKHWKDAKDAWEWLDWRVFQ